MNDSRRGNLLASFSLQLAPTNELLGSSNGLIWHVDVLNLGGYKPDARIWPYTVTHVRPNPNP